MFSPWQISQSALAVERHHWPLVLYNRRVAKRNPIDILLTGAELSVRRAGVFAYRKWYEFPPRRFDDWDLVLYRRGTAVWNIENIGKVHLRPGSVLLLPPGTLNGTAGRMTGPAELIGIHFHLNIESGAGFFHVAPHQPLLQVRQWRGLYDQAARIVHEYEAPGAMGREIVLRDLTRVLLVELCRLYARRTPGSGVPTDLRVLKVLMEMEERFAQSLTAADIARWAGLSPSHLRSLFQAELGMSPLQALIARRMREARRLLAGTSQPIAQIARQVGYDDPLYFSRAFREMIGQSPMDYRASAKTP
jgi:AraC-like DNA-binding protein